MRNIDRQLKRWPSREKERERERQREKKKRERERKRKDRERVRERDREGKRERDRERALENIEILEYRKSRAKLQKLRPHTHTQLYTQITLYSV